MKTQEMPLWYFTGLDAYGKACVRGVVAAPNRALADLIVLEHYKDVLDRVVERPTTPRRHPTVLMQSHGVLVYSDEPSNLTDTQPKEVG